jgi:alpha-tubulin suppressor-like RCC1 family protein
MYEEDEQIDLFEEKEVYEEIGDPDSCLLTCGRNKHRELTFKNKEIVSYPSGVKEKKNHRTFMVASGSNHSAILTEKGHLFMMGSTLHGKIGIPGAKFNQIIRPKMFPLSKDRCVVLVECSEFHTICLFDDGEVFSWGGTLHKKLGTASASPSLVAGLNKVSITKVGCGRYHSMALSSKFFFIFFNEKRLDIYSPGEEEGNHITKGNWDMDI